MNSHNYFLFIVIYYQKPPKTVKTELVLAAYGDIKINRAPLSTNGTPTTSAKVGNFFIEATNILEKKDTKTGRKG